jgi:hypothetical protein
VIVPELNWQFLQVRRRGREVLLPLARGAIEPLQPSYGLDELRRKLDKVFPPLKPKVESPPDTPVPNPEH